MDDRFLQLQFIEKYLDDSLSNSEYEELNAWLNDDIENKRAFERAVYVQTQIESINLLQESSKEEIWDHIAGQTGVKSKRQKGVANYYRWWPAIAAAASIALLAVVLSLFQTETPVTHATLKGEYKTIWLPDSSKVILNAASTVTYNLKNWNMYRRIELAGEAFFEVKRGTQFTVTTTVSETEVLGTSFNVLSRDNIEKITCKEGKVRVSKLHSDSSVVLTEKSTAIVTNGILNLIEDVDLIYEIGWLDGQFKFRGAPISRVMETINLQYNVSVTYPRKYEDQLFTGSFEKDNLEVTLDIVATSLGARYKIENQKTVTIY